METPNKRFISDYALTTLIAGIVGLALMTVGLTTWPELDLHWIALGAGWILATVYWAQVSKFWRDRRM